MVLTGKCRLHSAITVITPSTSGYVFPNAAAITPHLEHPQSGPTARLCAELATKFRCYVAAGYPERLYGIETDADSSGSTNTAVGANSALLYDPKGNCITNYRKSNLFETDMTWARAGRQFCVSSPH